MHQQIRSRPARSPADLAAFLQVLADAGISLVTAGGSDLESGGEFACSVAHPDQDLAVARLEEAGYQVRVLEPYVCWMTPGRSGELLRCVTLATAENVETGAVILDLALGEPASDGRIPVQIYSEVPGSEG